MAAAENEDGVFLKRIESALATAKAWDADSTLLAECRAQIPFQEINNNYARDDDILYRGNALFLKHLTLYFKENVMTWVNQPPCQNCGNQTMESRQTRGPQTQEELDGGASRVEVYDCSSCQNTTTFPRYNSVRKLLETRKGRCGEYANLFGLYCRAVGFETRYVSDFTDHVWVECLVDGEWIMADACEGLIDKNSMYEDGWGKDLNYIIAVTPDSVIDVTPRYTRKWFSPEFQARRRGICSSEEASQLIIKQYNAKIQSDCSKNRREELDRRMEREQKMLNICQQTTEWTDEEKHGKGRISGSLEWKLSRKEAGDFNQTKDESSPSVKSWHVESFFPSNKKQGITISISNDGIVVSDAECSVIGSQISVVVIDEVYLGCILQSRGFTSWKDVADFVDTLPSHRIVAIHGSSSANADSEKANGLSRLGGFTMPNDESKVLYLGQVDALAAWTKLASCNGSSKISVFMVPRSKLDVKLRTERDTVPSRVACRLPESIMPLQTQLLASEEQKRMAFLRFSGDKRATVKEYVGYTTKKGSPVYLLDASAYPFSKTEGGWNTFHYLPEPLVPKDDSGIVESTKKSGVPKIDIPLESFFFTTLLGPNVLVNSTPGSAPALVDTANALHNTRLVALYFSAHWCGPCRQFTPMLAELYSHLKDEYPTHGLEIVFVSSDRDPGGFQQYFGCMPWMAVPFGGTIIPQIKQRYGVRGIPALIVVDSISGQIVVPASETRREVMQACQRGDEGIEQMLDSWIARIPQESQEILAMLELSCEDEDEQDNSSNEKEHPYFMRTENSASSVKDPAAQVKETFAKLVAKGVEPNKAAAQAIQMITDQQKAGATTSFELGPLNDIDWKSIESSGKVSSTDLASEINKDELQTVLNTILKYLENVKKEPWTPRFRSFKLSNKIVDRITRVEGALDLVCSLGMYIYPAETDFMACIPLSMNRDEMEASIKDLMPEAQ